MKRFPRIMLAPVALGLLVAGCDVEQTEEGDMPDVDVDYQSGDMPEYDVDWADVDVGTRTTTVTVPKVDVYTEEEQVEVPYIDIRMPDDGEATERAIVVEIEATGTKPELEIESVYATERKLIVVSELEETDTPLDGERVRVSDRIMLNAPDLDVRHIIIGNQPEGNWNQQYTFVPDEDAVDQYISANARQIYDD